MLQNSKLYLQAIAYKQLDVLNKYSFFF